MSARTSWIDQYKVQGLPDGQSGIWTVDHLTITKDDSLFQFREMMTGRHVPDGTYTRLSRGSTVVMSDTPWEIRTNMWAIRAMNDPKTRSVFIGGLGIGMVLGVALRNPAIEQIVVAENSADVIALVAPHYDDPRLTIMHADVFDVQPGPDNHGERWDVVWFDIWDDVCEDYWPDMSTLRRTWARHCYASACWGREELRESRYSGKTYTNKPHHQQWKAKGRWKK